MKVLMVDDGDKKYDLLRSYLENRSDLSSVELVKVSWGTAARNEMRSVAFDLLILDILLPWKSDSQPSHDGSREIIESILHDETLLRPRNIVGLTADADAGAAADPYFLANTWTVLRFDETTDAWLQAIGSSISYLKAQSEAAHPYETDLLVITALQEPEMAALHRLPWNWQADEPMDDATFIRRGTFNSDGATFSVISAVADRMGMVSTAVLAAKAIAALKPRYIAMVGICAGIDGVTRLGDVVFADPVWDYQSGKRTVLEDGTQVFKVDPHQLPASQFVRTRMKQLALNKDALRAIRETRDDQPGHDLRVLCGPVATGSAVIADAAIVEEIKGQQHRKVLAIEMEAYGLRCAAENAGVPKPSAVIIKGVCDFADQKKNDSSQLYAAYTSAAVLKLFFETFMVELHPIAGT